MKIVIAPDSYKGSLTAMEVADSIEKGILKVVNDPIIEKIPMADGGDTFDRYKNRKGNRLYGRCRKNINSMP